MSSATSLAVRCLRTVTLTDIGPPSWSVELFNDCGSPCAALSRFHAFCGQSERQPQRYCQVGEPIVSIEFSHGFLLWFANPKITFLGQFVNGRSVEKRLRHRRICGLADWRSGVVRAW